MVRLSELRALGLLSVTFVMESYSVKSISPTFLVEKAAFMTLLKH